MKNIEQSYFSERRSKIDKTFIFDHKVLEYWKKILGDTIFEDIEAVYNTKMDTILFNEDFYLDNTNNIEEYDELYNKIIVELKNNKKNNDLSIFREKRCVFSNFFVPLVNVGINNLRTIEYKFLNSEVLYSYASVLLERLGKISLGVLIFEMYILKSNGKLVGNSPEGEYNFFNENYLLNSDYYEQIFELYPCLPRCIIETIYNLNEYYSSMLINLENDYNEIKNIIFSGEDFSDIKEIKIGISDPHKKGKVVSILEFDNGLKLLYKPRSLKVESVYNSFLCKLSEGCMYPMFDMHIVDKGLYGWEQFVEFKTCETTEELHRYFYRFGVLIFSNYLLNTNDLHEENLVASGEYPVIIDLETILDNTRKRNSNSAKEEISSILQDSILYSGLLPHFRFSNIGKGIDMSAIKGRSDEEYPIKIPKLKDLFTSNMRFEYESPVTSKNYNLVEYKGKIVNAYHFLDDINNGFIDAYKYVLNNKKLFLKYSNEFINLKVRHLVQDTQRYSMLLHTSFHPDFMQNGRDRQLFLCNLFKNYNDIQGSRQVVKYEIQDMLNMDIPYFYINTSKTELYSSSGDKIENYFSYTSIEHFRNKICRLSEEDLKTQIMYMDIVLTDIEEFRINSARKDTPKKDDKISQSNLNDVCRKSIFKIADTLIESAIFNKDKTEVNWIGVSLVGSESNSSWEIKPLGTYLYDGLSGLSIFFNSLYEFSKIKKYKDIGDAIDKDLFKYTNEMIERTEGLENESSGIIGGEASLVYTYEVLYTITKETKYLDYAIKHAEILKQAIVVDDYYDIIYGNAGAIIALLHLHELTNNSDYLNIATECGLRIVNAQEKTGGWKCLNKKNSLAGFSHGVSGIILALCELWIKVKKDNFLNSIEMGLKFENSLFVKEYANWKDERIRNDEKESDTELFTVAWCHGAPGILLSRIKLYQKLMGEQILFKRKKVSDIIKILKNDIDIATLTIKRDGVLVNNCLCHGNLGNIEILEEYFDIFNNKEIKEHCDKLKYTITKKILEGKFGCENAYLYGYILQGFMTGLSGMGYSLLRHISHKLPCVIALEI